MPNKSNLQPPLLPETTFKPLAESKLDAMIAHAVAQPQFQPRAQVVNLANWRQKTAFTGGMAAMAASIMLAFVIAPQYTTTVATTSTNTLSADVSDLILLDSLES